MPVPFSSLHFGMKTAIVRDGWRTKGPNISFSSLHFGMKTAIALAHKAPESSVGFQFPALWDEDCNPEEKERRKKKVLFFQFPALWDEDCNKRTLFI